MKESKNKKYRIIYNCVAAIIGVAIVTASIYFLVTLLIPTGMASYRSSVIKKQLVELYGDVELVEVKSDKKAIDFNKDNWTWIGEGISNEKMYRYVVEDSNGRNSKGFTNNKGQILFDGYAGYVYGENDIEEFEKKVGIRSEYPEVDYSVAVDVTINSLRVVPVEYCQNYEQYQNAPTVGFEILRANGYPGILVGFEEYNDEIVELMNNRLQEAGYEAHVAYGERTVYDANDKYGWYLQDVKDIYRPDIDKW